jgi:hypothetical protein
MYIYTPPFTQVFREESGAWWCGFDSQVLNDEGKRGETSETGEFEFV